MNSVRNELANAVREVNARLAELPVGVQDELDLSTGDLDLELDRALLSDDRDRALGAIDCWREHNLAQIRRVAR